MCYPIPHLSHNKIGLMSVEVVELQVEHYISPISGKVIIYGRPYIVFTCLMPSFYAYTDNSLSLLSDASEGYSFNY